MDQEDKLSPQFQMEVITCAIYSPAFLLTVIDHLDPDYFEGVILQSIVSCIVKLFKEGLVIDAFTIENEVLSTIAKEQEGLARTVLNSLKFNPDRVKYITERFREFATHQAIRIAIEKSHILLQEGKYSEIQDTVCSTFSKVQRTDFTDYFEEARKYLLLREPPVHNKTLIAELDTVIKGLKRGQLGVWVAQMKGGKSTALRHNARVSSFMGQNVLYYTLELGKREVIDCFTSAFTGVPLDDLREVLSDTISGLQLVSSVCRGKIFIVEMPPHSLDASILKAHLMKLATTRNKIDVIVIDYADLMSSVKYFEKEYEELERVYEELRAIAMEFKISIWTASQGNRGSIGKSKLTMDLIKGSIGKAAVADVMVGISITGDEGQRGKGRFQVMANRNGPAGGEIEFNCDFSRSLMYIRP
jgi:replicative DNA helicase